MTIPTFARSEKDFRAPFAPSGRFEGLTIDHLETFNAEDRFWARFQTDDDAEAFGAQWAAFARAALFPTLVGGLDGGVEDPRAVEFVEQLETAVAAAAVQRTGADADSARLGGAGQARTIALTRVSTQRRSG